MKRTIHTTAFKIAFTFSIIAALAGTASATPELDGVSFDPAFISAGDRVNISANLHETQTPETVWDEDKQLKVVLKPDNRLTEEYITIENDRDESIGFLYPDGVWNQRFQVKVDSGAPTGMYDFELHIQYLKNGEPVEIPTEDGSTITYIEDFSMPVDNEGVDISGNVLKTEPGVPRPGDDYVETHVEFTNTGNKPIEEVEIRPDTPEGIQPSYSSDEKFYINQLLEGESTTRTLTVNLDENLEAGLHNVDLSTSYEDESGNPYSENLQVPLRVEGRPDLELVNASMEMKAGETRELRVKVENTGEQDAESVTARIIAERSQPFSLEDRSNYIGEIESAETEEAVMKISSERSAALKTHQLKIQLRANGDSEEGDNSVYTFTEETEIQLEGRTQSSMIYLGIVAAALVLILGAYRYFKSRKPEETEDGGDSK